LPQQPACTRLKTARRLDWAAIGAAFSFANLCYLRVWSELLTYSHADTYTMKLPYSRSHYLAAMLGVLLAGGVGSVGAVLVRRSRSARLNIAGRVVLCTLLLLPLNALRCVLANQFSYLRSPMFNLLGTRGVLAAGLVLSAGGAVLVRSRLRQLAGSSAAVLLVYFPLVPVTFGQALWRVATFDASRFLDGPGAPALSAPSSRRVVWVILDEWDQRLTFVDRPADLNLTELDRLRSEALYAGNAYSPGPETPLSVPALITGRLVKEVSRVGPGQLLLVRPDGSPPVAWQREPNVFSDARSAGFNTAVVGWYHPYCRVLNESLTSCDWWPMNLQSNSMGRGLVPILGNQARSMFETSLLSVFGQSLPTREHARTYHEMMVRARQVMVDPGFGLIFLHLPTPHAPHAYNRRSGRFDLANSPIKGYVDSLALADRTVGDIRRTLEHAGLWENTTVLFTADHSYRSAEALDGKSDHRIPFLLKMAGGREPIDYRAPFNTLLTREFLRSILRSDVRTPRDAAAWLDHHRTFADSPFNN
jgi:hypothetical protein